MVVNCVYGSFHVKSPDGPMGNTSDFIYRKYYPENFSSILYMAQKLLLFELCQKSVKNAFCQRQARFSQLWSQITNQ